jgi:hypothetical protein
VHQPVVVPTTVLCCLHRRDDRRVSRKAFRLNSCGVGVTAARVSARPAARSSEAAGSRGSGFRSCRSVDTA